VCAVLQLIEDCASRQPELATEFVSLAQRLHVTPGM
jgi:hypothetical protein